MSPRAGARLNAAWTAKNMLFDDAPYRLVLGGDKTVAIESAQHIIEFPGGAIEVSRTDAGEYWAHIIVNDGEVLEEVRGRQAARGVVVDSRIDRSPGWDGSAVEPVPSPEAVHQIALLIRPEGFR